jgi:hypothetical protein
MNKKTTAARKTQWRLVSITMLESWRARLRDAIRLLGMLPVDVDIRPAAVTITIRTTRTAEEVENLLRGQLQFQGWMDVGEEDE